MMKALMMWVTIFLSAPALMSANAADSLALPDGSALDLGAPCPVCSMKIGSGKIGPAAIVLKDGKVVGFDGPGDLFRYLLQPGKFGLKVEDIKAVFVTDYKTKKIIDGKSAVYVVGAETTAGMGPEAVPFASKADAEDFKKSHTGKAIVPFSEVDLAALASPKKMLKMRHGEHGSTSGH